MIGFFLLKFLSSTHIRVYRKEGGQCGVDDDTSTRDLSCLIP
jgi:hypothetical protein